MSTAVGDLVPHQLGHEGKFQTLIRVGFFGRGLLYILIAWLAIGTGRTEDLTGALEYLGRGAGRLPLMAVAVGLAAYGLWRLTDAALGMEHGGHDAKAAWHRAGAGVIGVIYLYLAYKAYGVLSAGRAEEATPQQQADTVLDLPGGQIVLGVAAIILVAAAFGQFKKALSCSFLDKLTGAARAPAIKWLGRIGYTARGLIFLLVAGFIGKAALDGQSNEAGGLEQALDILSGPLLYAVAAGLGLFGLFSVIEAFYRRIPRPPIEQIPAKLT